MSGFRVAAEDYLAVRRAMGFKLARGEGLLFSFVTYLEDKQATTITTELALAWATLPAGAKQGWWTSRLCVTRGFARYMSAIDPATEVPPADLLRRLGPGHSRAEPYLYTSDEIRAVMAATGCMRDRFVAATCKTLIGLLAVTGMRVGEALRLDVGDIDWSGELLVIRDSKFERSRLVPLHPSTIKALRDYAGLRDHRFRPARSCSFFVTRSGRRVGYRTLSDHFRRLVRQAGLQPRSPRCRPRMHDFRH